MAVSYHFLTHAVQMDVIDVFTADDIVNAMQDIMRDPRAAKGVKLLANIQHADAAKVRTDQIKLGTYRALPLFPFFDNRIVLVVRSELQFGLSRMFQMYADHYGVQVTIFKSVDAAYEFIQEPCDRA
jgi:hypothetical protein